MPRYTVLLDKRAQRELERLPKDVVRRFAAVFSKLEENPYRPRPGCEIRIVKGHPRIKAIRVGDYRGLYEVVEAEGQVRFTKFGHRRSIYR